MDRNDKETLLHYKDKSIDSFFQTAKYLKDNVV